MGTMFPQLTPLRPRFHLVSLLGTIAVSLLFVGCESTRQYSIVPAGQAVPQTADGGFVVEKSHRVEVQLLTPLFSTSVKEIPTFRVAFQNRGETAYPFKPSDVAVYSGDHLVRAYLPVELVTRIQEEAARDAEEYTGQQAEVFLGSAGMGNSTTSDPSATIAKIEGAKRTNAAAGRHTSQADQIAEVVQLIIPMNVPPGETSSGLVKLHAEEIQPGQPLRVVVTVDGERYEFDFVVGAA